MATICVKAITFLSRRLEFTALANLSLSALMCCMGGGTFAQELDCNVPPAGGLESSEICNLGTFPGGTYSVARSVNADGTVLVGYSTGSVGGRAFRWVEGTEKVNLGTPPGGNFSYAYDVNADGTVVVGTANTSWNTLAFRWVDGTGMEILGSLDNWGYSEAQSVNADGTVVVGYSNSNDGRRAFRWVEGVGMESLGTLTGGTYSQGYGVSADGTVVVGQSNSSDGLRAFRWVDGSGMASLGILSGGTNSVARDVNADGTVVVGYSNSSDGGRAFRWVDGAGMESLGTLSGGAYSDAYDANADGTVVVGYSESSDGTRAFRWVDGTGMESLGTLTGGTYSYAYGVNADGTVVVGESGSGDGTRAFIWRAPLVEDTEDDDTHTGDVVPEPPSGGTMEDFMNLSGSIPILGNDSAVAQAEQQFALGRTMTQRSFAQAGQMIVSAQTRIENTGRNPTTVGARNSAIGAISFGRGINVTVTVGATISLADTSLKNNAFDMETGVGGALWGQYSQGGADRTGLQFSGAVGYMESEGEVTRGRLLTDVVLATGTSKVKTRAVQASVGHGLQHGNWLVTSSFGMAHYDTRRAAYTETGASFNASYNEMRTSRTVATLGVTGEFDIRENGRLSLGVGVDHEVNPERPRLTGSSDIPGLVSFNIDSTFTANRTREFATVGYTHSFQNGASITGNVRIGKAVYGSTRSVGVGIAYSMHF